MSIINPSQDPREATLSDSPSQSHNPTTFSTSVAITVKESVDTYLFPRGDGEGKSHNSLPVTTSNLSPRPPSSPPPPPLPLPPRPPLGFHGDSLTNSDPGAETPEPSSQHFSDTLPSLSSTPPPLSLPESNSDANSIQSQSEPPPTPPDPSSDDTVADTVEPIPPDSPPGTIPESILAPPAPPSNENISRENDETRALMEMFRKMRGMGGGGDKESQTRAHAPTPAQAPAKAQTVENQGAKAEPEPTRQTESIDQFQFPWEMDEPEVEHTVRPQTFSYWYTSREMSEESELGAQDTPETRRSKALRFLESLMARFFYQLQDSAQQLEPGRDNAASGSRGAESQSTDSSHVEQSSFGVRMSFANRKTGKMQDLLFPSDIRPAKTAAVLVQMSRVLFISSVLYESILTNGLVTKRDIYYRKVGLFGNQRIVDKIVDDLVCTARLKRQDFCVCATSKGLLSSNALKVYLTTGGELSMSSSSCALIPPQERIERLEAPDGLEWILVVEKDAVMQAICGARLLDDERLGPGAVITGKGYPDLSTLQLLRRITDDFPSASIYALVDADPHGVDILSVYAFGSLKNAYSEDHIGLPLGDRLEWIGVKATELTSIGRYDDLLPLGERDRQLAIKMCTSRDHMPPEWRRELAHMVHLQRKAEIQILCGTDPNEDELEQALLGTQVDESSGAQQAPRNRLIEYIVERVRR